MSKTTKKIWVAVAGKNNTLIEGGCRQGDLDDRIQNGNCGGPMWKGGVCTNFDGYLCDVDSACRRYRAVVGIVGGPR